VTTHTQIYVFDGRFYTTILIQWAFLHDNFGFTAVFTHYAGAHRGIPEGGLLPSKRCSLTEAPVGRDAILRYPSAICRAWTLSKASKGIRMTN